MLEVIDLQRRCNLASANRWGPFSAHRRRVTALALAAGGGTLAVLGAGNSNDLDLARLAEAFREIHLVDLDGDALGRARARQRPDVAERLVLHGGVDLSGALGALPAYARTPPTEEALAALPGLAVARVLAALPGPFDAVVSTCCLGQDILHGCAVALGPGHAQLPALSCALALAHVRALALLARPGRPRGADHRHGLVRGPARARARLPAAGPGRGGPCARGGPPLRLRDRARVLATHARGRRRGHAPAAPAAARAVAPWLWRFGDTLTYLVHALVVERRPSAPPSR